MKHISFLAAVIVSILVLSACSQNAGTGATTDRITSPAGAPSANVLLGTFAIREHGQLHDFVRVQQSNGQYTMSDHGSAHWSPPHEVLPVDRKELNSMFKKEINTPYVGLGQKDMAIFKMPPGWKIDTFITNTGYWLATPLGPIELYKR